VHCWVCDEVARSLNQSGRTAVAEYLQLIKGGEQSLKKVSLNYDRLHPSIRYRFIISLDSFLCSFKILNSRAVEVIEPYFQSMMLEEQDILGNEEGVKKLLGMVPDEQLRCKLETEMMKQNDSVSRWEIFEELGTKTKKVIIIFIGMVTFNQVLYLS
jgi:DNA primase small subunit